jgi:signal transduction histidine kinase
MSTASSCTVLTIDDDQAVRDVRSKILERAGYRVLDAGTGAAALDLIGSERPALVVLDVNLPDRLGMNVCQQIKQNPRTARTLVLQISAYYTPSEDRTMGLEYGADSYLSEPVPEEEFLASVQALLRLRSPEGNYRSVRRKVTMPGVKEQALVVSQDPTEAQQHIRRLVAQLGAVKQQEQEKLAQSLHDDLAQLLVVARMKLHQPTLQLPEKSVEDIDRVLDQCLTYTRSLMSDLLPPELYHGQLDLALRGLAVPMSRHGLTVEVTLPEKPIILAEETAMTLLKCARELLFNVLKHAGTRKAYLTLAVRDGLLQIIVQDHGKGCEVMTEGGYALHSFGLLSVRQRVDALGGRLEIESELGEGTRAVLTVPYSPLLPW